MKLAFSSLGCPSYTLDQVIEAALRYGYEGVSLRTVAGESYLPALEEFSPPSLRGTQRKFARAKLQVVCVMSGVRFTSPQDEERRKQLADAEKYLDIAQALEAPYVRLFGGPSKPEQEEARTMEWIVAGFRQAAEMAEKRGVEVLVETHDSFSTGARTKDLLARIDRPLVGVVWDFLHSSRFGESLADTWASIGSRVRDVHVKDSLVYSPTGFDIKLPGEGRLPIRAAVALLRSHGYAGYYTFEWEKGWHPEVPEAEAAFPHYVRYMRELMAGLEA